MPETNPDPFAAAEALRQEIIDDYSVYVATQPISVGGAPAFSVGDPVPKGHVDRGVVDKSSVARVDTKAAKAATGQEG